MKKLVTTFGQVDFSDIFECANRYINVKKRCGKHQTGY